MTLLRLPRPPLLARPSSAHGHPPAFRRLRLLKPVSASSSSFPTSGGNASQRPHLSSSRTLARDRVIDFGRHRGRMLGTLPSSYLAWVSKNLRARDSEEWARLADEVLRDPVYRDRLEWEAAERVLTGAGLRAAAPSESAVAELLGISERFGWDNDDKDGWRRVDLQLLGTSRGGRIPRLRSGGAAKSAAGSKKDPGFRSHGEDARPASPAAGAEKSSIKTAISSEKPMFAEQDGFYWVHEARKPGALHGTKVGHLSRGFGFTAAEQEEGEEEEGSVEGSGKNKREERRERGKQKRKQQMRMLRREVGVDADGGDRAVAGGQTGGEDGGRYRNPFPGRGALLGKVSRRGAS